MKEFDRSFLNERVKIIAGVDEAGRGPLAGPVVAAAVIFENDVFIPGINDSKKLTEKKREELYSLIIDRAASYGIGIVGHTKIDQINILQSTLMAMKKAVSKLQIKPDLILIDGNKIFSAKIPAAAIVKGDSKSFSIAAASILAKVTRDRIMIREGKKYPVFKWHKNKGYGTKEHISAIRKNGITPLHRRTFLSRIIPDTSGQNIIPFPEEPSYE